MKTVGLVVLAAAVAVAAAFVSLDSSRLHDDGVAVLEIRGGDDGLQLIPVDGGAAGPESVAFDDAGGGPYTGVSDGRVLRWLPAERRWVDHSSSAPSSRLPSTVRQALAQAAAAHLKQICHSLHRCKAQNFTLPPAAYLTCFFVFFFLVSVAVVSSHLAMRAEVLVLAALVAAAALLSSLDSLSDVRRLELGDGDLELVPLDGAVGPETIIFGDGGEGPFTGVSDGRVLRWLPDERRWEEHSCSVPDLLDSCRGSQDPGREHECGRPLGLKFNDKTGELYVADAYHGLRVVGPDDNVSRPLVPEWQGSRPFSFANGIEIDYETGAIYFTETSTRFHRREFLNIVITGDKTGRLLKYDPKTNKVEVLVEGLAFANGLAMSTDGNYLLIAETTSGKILRYWIKTPKASTLEEVVQIPWFPDNIRLSPRGGFWVGLHAKRGKIAEWSITYPWLKRLILKVPMRYVQRASWFLNQLGRQVIALRLSDDGKIIEAISVHGSLQKVFRSVSEVEERNGVLWIGSVMSPFLGVYKL
ncbi:hypothetical protein HU200_060521 [Digitaria exilis]|uniref:Strictosidine synthase conserved region domain-containing protein n=1 Tax=Digitaria exilis TaxID=1010633 RepID=A0A835AGF1_9POAL|nr:hypothetical protein HU200_060521 [Digitaria exilis]